MWQSIIVTLPTIEFHANRFFVLL